MLTRKEVLKKSPIIIGGPCSVASKEQIMKIAQAVKKSGADALRAQLWKPRTDPNSFQGVGMVGIKWLQEVKEKIGIPLAMEVTAPQQVKEVAGIADIMWVGARNMQNFELLKEIGKYPHAVILKRGFIATVKEWICAATYIGVEKVIFCERGIRTGVDSMRFTLDLNGMLVMKHDYKHPVIVDISHSPGRRDMVLPLGYAAMAAGADGIVVETHYNPDEELVDRAQTIDLQSFDKLVRKSEQIYNLLHK